jgi:hypothetical protein
VPVTDAVKDAIVLQRFRLAGNEHDVQTVGRGKEPPTASQNWAANAGPDSRCESTSIIANPIPLRAVVCYVVLCTLQ